MAPIIIIAILALISTIILPWINFIEIKRLKKTIHQFKYDSQNEPKGEEAVKDVEFTTSPIPKVSERESEMFISETIDSTKIVKNKSKIINFEQKFLTRLPIWIGGFALALAGLFLIKYSIDKNLLSPIARIILSSIFALTLICCAEIIHNRPDFSNGTRITQSLAGAGIAIFYAISFASVRLYEMIPAFGGFVTMAIVTLASLILSLRYGAPMALLGMAVGFLSPLLFNDTQKDTITLFIYLYFMTAGLLLVARKNNWWWLAIPAIAISMTWAAIWMIFNQSSENGIHVILFLIAISTTIIFTSRKQYRHDSELPSSNMGFARPSFIINYVGISIALSLAGIIAKQGHIDNLEWGLFGLIAISAIATAYFNEKLYGFLPWLSMLVNIAMLCGYKTSNAMSFSFILLALSFIYVISGYFIMLKSRLPLLWAGIVGTGTLLFYFTGYFKLHKTEISLDWSLIALLIGFMAIFAISRVQKFLMNCKFIQHIYTIFAIVATAAISSAIFIKIDNEFFSTALAVEILAISWINTKFYINSLRTITKVLFYIFIITILKQLFLVINQIFYSLAILKLTTPENFLFLEQPVFHLGVPTIAIFASTYFLRKKKEDHLVKILEISSTVLFSTMLYYLIHNAFLAIQIQDSFLKSGIFTNALFIFGLYCLYISKKSNRDSFLLSGTVIFLIATFRIVYFDILFQNPIWNNQKIAGIIFLNSLLLPYGFPILYTHLAKIKLKEIKKEKFLNYLNAFIMLSAFILVNLNVRHVFHGQYLGVTSATEVEKYTYSAVWLMLSLLLLFIGAIKNNQSLRYASLILLLLTIGKVFLYDASSLEGLYRVLSFLGLGLSLVGIGYFYASFILKKI